MKRWLAVVCCATITVGCTSALRKPPTVTELAGDNAGRSVTDVDRLLREAERAYAAYSLESVRHATECWLAAAAADESRTEALIGASRGGIWLSGREPEAEDRKAAARSAVQAAQLCAQAAADEPPACAYWLAVALGVQAREQRTTARNAVSRMVSLLEDVAVREPGLEHGGPDRVLALVLLRAPGWPAGPGDPERGLEHARRAVALDPDHPPNQLCLAEALAANDDPEGSARAYARAAELAGPRARAGDPEAREWLAEARSGQPSEKDR